MFLIVRILIMSFWVSKSKPHINHFYKIIKNIKFLFQLQVVYALIIKKKLFLDSLKKP
jgi:hypothetical protein